MKLNFRAMIEVLERLVVRAAAIAVFPLYQWYSEKEERRLERVTTFVSAGSECLNYTDLNENVALLRLEPEAWDSTVTNTVYARLNIANMCIELYDSLLSELLGDSTTDELYVGEKMQPEECFEPI